MRSLFFVSPELYAFSYGENIRMMRWILALHIIAMVCWFAGLFYLPRLFVYHTKAEDKVSQERFKIMERRLYYGIMTPAGLLTILLGVMLMSFNWHVYFTQLWMHAKLGFVTLLVFYHLYCGYLLRQFKQDKNRYSERFYRCFNEIPTVLLIIIVILAVVKPF